MDNMTAEEDVLQKSNLVLTVILTVKFNAYFCVKDRLTFSRYYGPSVATCVYYCMVL